MNSTHIEFLCNQFPQYAYWLTTGGSEYGANPEASIVMKYFTEAAQKFALAISEYEYLKAAIDFAVSGQSTEDENGCPIPSPIPSQRKTTYDQVLNRLLTTDLNDFLKSKKLNTASTQADVECCFIDLGKEILLEIQGQYGVYSTQYLMLSRLFNETLLPGSISNIFHPFDPFESHGSGSLFAPQQEDNGVEKAFFDHANGNKN